MTKECIDLFKLIGLILDAVEKGNLKQVIIYKSEFQDRFREIETRFEQRGNCEGD